jgi:hypothetical protein
MCLISSAQRVQWGRRRKVCVCLGERRKLCVNLPLHRSCNIKKFLSLVSEEVVRRAGGCIACGTGRTSDVKGLLSAMWRSVSGKRRDAGQGSDSAASKNLAGAFLAVLSGVFEPAPEDTEGLRFDFEKGKAAAEIGLDVDDLGFGVEELFAGKNLYEDQSVLREGIHHIEIATVEAQFADASGDAHVGFLLDELGAGNESVTRRAALFSFQEDPPLE